MLEVSVEFTLRNTVQNKVSFPTLVIHICRHVALFVMTFRFTKKLVAFLFRNACSCNLDKIDPNNLLEESVEEQMQPIYMWNEGRR